MDSDRPALDLLFSVTYEELRRLAATVVRDGGSETLRPTALVNEAYIKLARSPEIAATSRTHFKRIAARAMRQVLVDAARQRSTRKRGGAGVQLTLDDERDAVPSPAEDVLALDAALQDLARLNPRQALVLEYRYFGGYELAETAELLDISESTILRDWRAAKAWLALELRRTG